MLKFNVPYNDLLLVYNEKTEQYEFSLTEAKSLVGSPFQDDAIFEQHLKDISNSVYSYMYHLGNTNNKVYTKLIVNYSDKGRKFIYKALESQLRADADNGYDAIKKQNPVDFQNGKVIDREEIRRNLVCVSCENILKNSSADLDGYNVCYEGVFYDSQLFDLIGVFDL